MYYLIYDQEGNVTGTGVTPDGTFPENSIQCTYEQYNNSWKLRVVGGVIVDRYTQQELNDITAEQQRQQLVAKAKILLSESDYRVLPDKFIEYSSHNQTAIIDYRAALRLVVNGESNALPTLVLE